MTTNDIIKKSGLSKVTIAYRADTLGIQPKKINNINIYTEEQAKEIIKFNKRIVEKIVYKPIHTYINYMIIPSKMNFIPEEFL